MSHLLTRLSEDRNMAARRKEKKAPVQEDTVVDDGRYRKEDDPYADQLDLSQTESGVSPKAASHFREAVDSGKAKRVQDVFKEIKLPPLVTHNTILHLRAITPVISHRFTEKAKQEILDKKMGIAKGKRPPCVPEQEFEDAKYKTRDGREGLPALAFKCAIVDAASYIEGVTKVIIRGALFVESQEEVIPFTHFDECIMRSDVVRVGTNRAADIRFRPMYVGWKIDVPVSFMPRVLSAEQLHHLALYAGFSVGICGWRPQKDGQYGRFTLDTEV
jgi:hypothetical protein